MHGITRRHWLDGHIIMAFVVNNQKVVATTLKRKDRIRFVHGLWDGGHRKSYKLNSDYGLTSLDRG